MIAIYVGMYIATIPNRGSPPAILLRQGYREEGKVKNRTLANLTHWPAPKVDRLRRVLRDEPLAPVDQLFEVVASTHHGHVQAVLRHGKQPLEVSRRCVSGLRETLKHL